MPTAHWHVLILPSEAPVKITFSVFHVATPVKAHCRCYRPHDAKRSPRQCSNAAAF